MTLGRPATEISLFDLCAAMDDQVIQPRCMLGTAVVCSDERAGPAHEFWTGNRATILDFPKNMLVADVAAFETRRRRPSPGLRRIPPPLAGHFGSATERFTLGAPRHPPRGASSP